MNGHLEMPAVDNLMDYIERSKLSIRENILDDPDIVYLMENLITYALIRDDYRNFVKKKAQKKKGEER